MNKKRSLSDKKLGILMLDTVFDRPVGDVGNPDSWPFPVIYEVVKGAQVQAVVQSKDDAALLMLFISAGKRLIDEGACVLITSCGFLAISQATLAHSLSCPVATSSLLQIPLVQRCLPKGQHIGVVVYDEKSFTAAHLLSVGASPDTPVAGLPERGEFRDMIAGESPYHHEGLLTELIQVVEELLKQHANIGALVFECTNLSPFSREIKKRFGLPVFDVLHLGRWLMSGVNS